MENAEKALKPIDQSLQKTDGSMKEPGRKDGIEKKCYLQLEPDASPLDSVIEKAEHMNELLREAMEIAESIASIDLDLQINAVVNDKTAELARIITE